MCGKKISTWRAHIGIVCRYRCSVSYFKPAEHYSKRLRTKAWLKNDQQTTHRNWPCIYSNHFYVPVIFWIISAPTQSDSDKCITTTDHNFFPISWRSTGKNAWKYVVSIKGIDFTSRVIISCVRRPALGIFLAGLHVNPVWPFPLKIRDRLTKLPHP